MKPPKTVANTPMGELIVVDDNLRLSEELSLVLQAAGWSVRCADDGESLRACIAQQEPDIVVLDLNLPGEDGISLCKWLRSTHPRTGIVLLTARVMGIDRTEGYMAGADIYLTKPTRAEELQAVMHNLRRRSQFASQVIAPSQEPPWTLHTKDLRLLSPKLDMLSLTPNECVLLETLASINGLCNYELLTEKMGHTGLSDKQGKARLEVIVSRLRSKLAKFPADRLEIKTDRGTGYGLTRPLAIKTKETKWGQ
jgi:DNA-binding response OmpR family regulator